MVNRPEFRELRPRAFNGGTEVCRTPFIVDPPGLFLNIEAPSKKLTI